jgi:DivIVA domain-containing protein
MRILSEIVGCVLVFTAAVMAPAVVRALVRARRSGGALPGILWQSLWLLCFGVGWLSSQEGGRWGWIGIPVDTVGLIFMLVPGVTARRRAGISWWRFWAGTTGHVDSTDAAPSADIQETETVDLIQRIQNVVFRTTRLRAGYNEREVDRFLDRVITVLREGRDLEGLRNPRFSTTRLSPGYDTEDVDNFLREIELSG